MKRAVAKLTITLALGVCAPAWAQTPGAGDEFVLQAGRYVAPDGQLLDDARLVIRDGKLVSCGGAAPAGLPVRSFPEAVLCPGLIDCYSSLGVQGRAAERDSAMQPDLSTRFVFDEYSRQFEDALRAGVTACALMPAEENLIGGRVAICRTASASGGPTELMADGPLVLSLAPAVFKRDREPTSRSGAIGLLREALEAARTSREGVLYECLAGRRRGVFITPSAADVLTARQFADEFKLRLSLVHTREARELAETLTLGSGCVIVGPLGAQAGLREAEAAGWLARDNVRVALAGGLPLTSADALRVGAAIAARNGLSAAAARAAITSVPAEVLGLESELGSLRPGLRADVVVFSGDPLDLRSRVLAVYVDGSCVYQADAHRMEVPWK